MLLLPWRKISSLLFSSKRVLADEDGMLEGRCWVGVGVSLYLCDRGTKLKFLNVQGIDSKESIPPAYVACRAGTTNGVIVPARQC
jgi:hypothetical protein